MARQNVDRESLYAETLPAAYLLIIDVRHSTLSEPLRFVKNTEEIEFNSETYSPFNFDASLPDDNGDAPGVGTLTVSNVDLQITKLIRQITTPIEVDLRVVLSSDLSDVQCEYLGLSGRTVPYNASTITFELSYEDVLNAGFPGRTYNLSTFPNL